MIKCAQWQWRRPTEASCLHSATRDNTSYRTIDSYYQIHTCRFRNWI